ncbi:MAG TPA: stage II sporulation protein M [Thermoanaerobaculia bacterium]|nr:stage II sporulation protein M [Thermoanaerobaculia bacterium]
MSRERFEDLRAEEWRRFADLVGRLESVRNRPTPETAELPALYRRICLHLALVRERRYGVDLEDHLNRLALRGHRQLYRGERISGRRIVELLAADFPARLREEWRLVLVASLLFLVPALATGVAVTLAPEVAYSVMHPEMVHQLEEMYRPDGEVVREADSDVMMFGFYVHNNVGIAFRTFAGGVLFGLGSIFFLVYNGLFLGAVAAFLGQAGLGGTFWPFVVGHSAFELPAIVFAGAAGLRLGLAVVAPGRRSRGAALAAAARRSLPLVAGIAFLLVLAAFVEAFWSSNAWLPDAVRYGVGAALWLAFFTYLAVGGRGGR